MSTDPAKNIDAPETIETLKAKLAEIEAGKGSGDDPENFEIRFKKAQTKNVELTESLRGLTSTITGMEAENKTRELKTAESSGDFKAIVQMKDTEIEALQTQLENAKLDVTRLIIGRKNNLPDEVAKLLQGSNADEIEAQAITVRAAVKPKSGFSDARQSGGVIVTGNGPKKPRTNYIPVRPEGAF